MVSTSPHVLKRSVGPAMLNLLCARFLKQIAQKEATGHGPIPRLCINTDYGHMKAKSLILCGPNANSNTKWI